MAQVICVGSKYGNSLYVLYLFHKLLYLANIAAQLYVLLAFLGIDHDVNLFMHGYDVLAKLVVNQTWESSRNFPVNTVCRMYISRDGDKLPYTIECVLPINIYNDKIFTFVIIILQLLAVISVLNFLRWLWTNCSYRRRHFVKEYLVRAKEEGVSLDLQLCDVFTSKYLHRDAVFILQLVEINVGGVVVSCIISRLWSMFQAAKYR